MAAWRKDARGDFTFVFPGIARVAHALGGLTLDLCWLCCAAGAVLWWLWCLSVLPVPMLHAPCLNSGADHMIRTGTLTGRKDPEPRGGNREARGGKPACST